MDYVILACVYVILGIVVALDLKRLRRNLINDCEAAGDKWSVEYLRNKWRGWC